MGSSVTVREDRKGILQRKEVSGLPTCYCFSLSAGLSVISDVREKRHFANSGKVLYTLNLLQDQQICGCLVQNGKAGPLFVNY